MSLILPPYVHSVSTGIGGSLTAPICVFQKVRTWFYNRTKSKKAKLPRGYKRSYTGERVFECLKHEEIRVAARTLNDDAAEEDDDDDEEHEDDDDDEQDDHEGGVAAQSEFPIVKWNRTRRRLWRKLSLEEKEPYERTAERWNEEGPDAEHRAA